MVIQTFTSVFPTFLQCGLDCPFDQRQSYQCDECSSVIAASVSSVISISASHIVSTGASSVISTSASEEKS